MQNFLSFKRNESSTKRLKHKSKYVIELLKASKSYSGNKAWNLRFLEKHGFRIPLTYVLEQQVFEDYLREPDKTIQKIEKELEVLLSINKKYALRSSTDIEDSSSHSYAGQFLTVLNVENKSDIIKAIIDIWKSSNEAKIVDYSKNVGSFRDSVKTSVIIQEMVESKYSGAVFTKNPLTGFDEVIVELVEGFGTSLVQDGLTPERWVRKWGAWKEKPVNPFTEEKMLIGIVLESKKIQKKYGKPIDLEWAFDGKNLYWLQLREITTLKKIKLYSNRMAREMIPGVILPLVWSINIPTISKAWKLILKDLFGDSASNLDVMNLAKSFYGRTYFNMGLFGDLFSLLGMPRESLELMLGLEVTGGEKPMFSLSGRTLRYFPRIMSFSFGITLLPHRINSYIAEHKRFLDKMRHVDLNKLDYSDSLDLIDRVMEIGVKSSYIVVISQLMHSMFQMMSKSKKMYGVNYYDSNFRLNELYLMYSALTAEEKQCLEDVAAPATHIQSGPYQKFMKKYQLFLKDFGHYSEHSNDMSYLTWRENPKQIIDLVKNYNPTVTSTFQNRSSSSIADIYKQYRENVTYLYTKNYSYFRPIFLQISSKLVKENILNDVNDVFYLSYDEIKDTIKRKEGDGVKALVEKRKREIESVRLIDPPELIFSDKQPEMRVASENQKTLKGLAVSSGKFYGTARIVKTIADAINVGEGDIIVIPYSDVSWTSLFTKVGGIISESGGMLSHSAIIARELNIPAVVAVRNAMNIKDGSSLLLDGDLGEIKIG
jgi:phosphohistidine swiveling domain-containing protein